MEKRDVIYDTANQPTPFPPNSLCIHPPSFLAAGGGGGHISSRSLTPKPPFIKPPPSIVFRDRGGGEGGEGGGGQQNENFIHIFPFSSLFSPSLTGGKQMPANLGGKSGGEPRRGRHGFFVDKSDEQVWRTVHFSAFIVGDFGKLWK